MNEGPFRVPRSVERKPVDSRLEPARPQVDEPRVDEGPTFTSRPDIRPRADAREKKSRKRFLVPVIVIIVVILVAVGGWFAWSRMQNSGTAIDGSKYQAVFFTNGQVYFGKLHPFNSDYMKLTDIYYLQSQQSADSNKNSGNPQTTSNNESSVQLIKLGDEIHGPEDEMIVSKDQVLFYENLKPTGKVAQSIAKYKKAN